MFSLTEKRKNNHASSQGERRNAHKVMRENFHFKVVGAGDVEQNKEKHQFEDLSSKIIGAAIQVHRELGPGFLESIYEEALRVELSENGFHFDCQKERKIEYLRVEVGMHRLDIVVEKKVAVALKAVAELSDIHFAQLRSYLNTIGLKVGFLLNFSKSTLEIRRVVN